MKQTTEELKKLLAETKKKNKDLDERKKVLKELEEEEAKHLTGWRKFVSNAIDYIGGK